MWRMAFGGFLKILVSARALLSFLLLGSLLSPPVAIAASGRITSIYLSQTLINEQLKAHMHSDMMKDFKIELNTKDDTMLLRGLIQVPVEQMKSANLDAQLGAFRFQLTIKPDATKEGYLILEFPLNETFFYPASSKNPARDRVVVPVQMLSLAMASARGYFAALAGDFSGFKRKSDKLTALIKALNKSIEKEKNPDARATMATERDSLTLQLAGLPIERKQIEAMAKEVGGMLGFAGGKEINLNEHLASKENALIIKLSLAKFAPFLTGVELGGVRMVHDKKDGLNGENYFSIDINADTQLVLAPRGQGGQGGQNRPKKVGMKEAPAAMIRINQSLFESELILSAEKKSMGSKLTDLKIDLKEDGLHVSGKYHKFFFSVPFDTVVDLNTISPDIFDVKIRDIQIAGMDFQFLTGFVLKSLETRLEQSLKGICQFDYVGTQEDHSRALRVTVDPRKLIPALSGMHVVDVDIREREFLFKIGKIAQATP
jgi:hypothetical protein